MGVLILGPEIQAAVDKVRAFAEQKANWYHPTPDEFNDKGANGNPKRPGNDPGHNYEVQLGTYRCIYSITETDQGAVRHLSIKAHSGVANPIMAFEIVRMFGFNPDERHWQLSTDDCTPPCLVVIEPIEFTDPETASRWRAMLKSRGVE